MLLTIFSNNIKNVQETWEGINALLNRKKKTLIKINCLKQPDSNTTTNMKSRILNVMNEGKSSLLNFSTKTNYLKLTCEKLLMQYRSS